MTGMKRNRKKNQHYVFRAYLRPWATDEQIWCLRDGRVFRSNLSGVACERFFYRIYELTADERQFLEKVVIDDSPEPVKNILKDFLRVYCHAQDLKEGTSELPKSSQREDILNSLIESANEDYHAIIEDRFLRFLMRMRDGDADFFKDDKASLDFLFGLCNQFTRTKQVRESALRRMGNDVKGRRTLHLMSAMSYLIAIRLAYSLYVDRDQFKVVLVKNNSSTPFITTDQPIVNFHGQVGLDAEPPEKLELFYPLSPRQAMFFLERNTETPTQIGDVAANNYNVIMAEHSHEEILSDSEEYLNCLKSVIGDKGRGQRLKRLVE